MSQAKLAKEVLKEEKEAVKAVTEKKIKFVMLHESFNFIGTKLGTNKTLSASKYSGLKMRLTPPGLEISVNGLEFLVPHQNVCGYAFE